MDPKYSESLLCPSGKTVSRSKYWLECQELTLKILKILSCRMDNIDCPQITGQSSANSSESCRCRETDLAGTMGPRAEEIRYLLNKIMQNVLESHGWNPDGENIDSILCNPDYDEDNDYNIYNKCYAVGYSGGLVEKSFFDGAITVSADYDYRDKQALYDDYVKIYARKIFGPYVFIMTKHNDEFGTLYKFSIKIIDYKIIDYKICKNVAKSIENILKILSDTFMDSRTYKI
jgi:hypothetical protein